MSRLKNVILSVAKDLGFRMSETLWSRRALPQSDTMSRRNDIGYCDGKTSMTVKSTQNNAFVLGTSSSSA